MEETQVYTIPLRDADKAGRKERAGRAVKIVKDFLKKHMNVTEVKIRSDLNKKIWKEGAENPPSKIRVKADKISEDTLEASTLE